MTSTKKRAWLSVALIVTAVLAFMAGSKFGSEPSDELTDSATVQSNGPMVLYWRAPMDPNERYDAPGKSKMGMDLIPVYDEPMQNPSVVKIDPVALQRINFKTEKASYGRLSPTIRTTGRLTMDERGFTSMSLKVGGWIEKLHVNFDGAMVRDGDPILDLYSPELVATQEEYLLALRNLDRTVDPASRADAERVVAAARRRLEFWDVTDAQIERLEQDRTVEKRLTFFAPHSGEVMHMNAVEGRHVEAGDRLLDVANISTIWLIVDIHEEDLSHVRPGIPGTVEVRSRPGEVYRGTVDYVYHMMNPELRTVRARIVLPGSHGGPLKPGMFATATLETGQTSRSLLVSDDAVIRTGERELIIVHLGDGRFRPTVVNTGLSAGGQTQVLSGLREGDEIVTSAQFLIDSEARLRGVVAAMEGSSTEVLEGQPMDGMHMHEMGADGMDMPGMREDDMDMQDAGTHDMHDAVMPTAESQDTSKGKR